ncbi:hypothetical protein C8R43DRAFT_958843 [Mycena crocata]|nr:hypothetical protein C8R43DRAFT_958843 [Mycena crocata]
MPTIPNTLVVFGPNEEVYFLGHGRRYSFQGIPDEFATKVQGADLPVTQTGWIAYVLLLVVYGKTLSQSTADSLDPTGTKYIGKNDDRKQFSYSGISEEIVEHIKANGGVTFIALGDDDYYFIKHSKGWNARLPPKHLQNVHDLKPRIDNFDSAIRGLLFGHNQTHIFLFVGGFLSDLNEETQKDAEHPLTQVLTEFDEGWCIEPGSTLCPYSDRYFFLRFKKPNDSVIQSRWCLPEVMSQKLAELKELTASPEDDMFLTQLRLIDMQKQQAEAALAMQQMRMQTQMNDMFCQTMIQGGNGIKMATGGYVEVRR